MINSVVLPHQASRGGNLSPESTSLPIPGWANRAGRIFLKALRGPVVASEAIDRVLIAERISRYGWAYDERDRTLFSDCFVEESTWEGSVMGDVAVGPFVGREAIVAWNTDFWNVQTDQRRHVFTNVIVDELGESSAVAHAYLLLTSSAQERMTPVTTGAYRLDLVKEDGVWRIKYLVSSFDTAF